MRRPFAHGGLDPRSKLALSIGVLTVSMAATDVRLLVALLGFTALLVVTGGGLGVAEWIRSLGPILYFLPILLVLNTLFYAGGTPIATIHVAEYPIGVTTGGLMTAIHIALRLLVVTAIAAWFAATTAAEEIEVALVELHLPWSVAFIAALTVRLVPEMRRRFADIENAQRARGLSFEGGPIARARARLPIVLPFLSAVIRYGYDLSDALRARGFHQATDRTSLVSVEHTGPDYLLDLLALGLLVVAVRVGFW
ncbi:MAG: energy-coupling factor transporter transmembrane component T [Halodesulfurarchaeum sp.]